MKICHLVGRDEWAAGDYRPSSLDVEGFVHFSTPEQVVATANRFYAGRTDLLLLVLDVGLIAGDLRWEPAAGQLFPHLYGPIERAAVVATHPFPPGPDGTFVTSPI